MPRLLYAGTATEVRLGDRVRIRRLLRKDLLGTVSYLPGVSPAHRELEFDDVRQWAIRADNGMVYAYIYSPDYVQPSPKIVFLGRGPAISLDPEEQLDEWASSGAEEDADS